MFKNLNPYISVDCVVFGYDSESLKVLLVERDLSSSDLSEKSAHDLKLPGSLVYNDELLVDAAKRVLRDLTGLDNIFLDQFDVLDSLERISNTKDKEWLEHTTGLSIDRVISIAYYSLVTIERDACLGNSDSLRWVPVDQTGSLPFDHSEIISRAYSLLCDRLAIDDIAFGLLPKKFSINELQKVFQVFTGNHIDSRNFRKKLKTMNFIVPLDEKQNSVAHKPARLYKFDKKRFIQFRKDWRSVMIFMS